MSHVNAQSAVLRWTSPVTPRPLATLKNLSGRLRILRGVSKFKVGKVERRTQDQSWIQLLLHWPQHLDFAPHAGSVSTLIYPCSIGEAYCQQRLIGTAPPQAISETASPYDLLGSTRIHLPSSGDNLPLVVCKQLISPGVSARWLVTASLFGKH